MSWVVEEWKQGLPTKALQKIQEIETQLDKLKKERQQRQFQLESLEAALLKQKQKVENEKTETSALKREHQNLIESCENLEKIRQKISHDLQVKESQVNYLEGQLASNKIRMDKLEQENKRYKSELERSQQTVMPGDAQSRTPQRNLSGPVTPTKNIAGKLDPKLEELQEQYNKEVEERKRLETELKTIQTKLSNQTQSQSTAGHRNMAHQRSSFVFPWQQEQTPSHQTSHSLETPMKKGIAMNFQWDQEETPLKHCPKSLQKTTHSTSWINNSVDSSKQEDRLKLQNQDLQTKVSDLELRLKTQEKEIKNHLNRLHEIQFQFDKAKVDLSEKEQKLSKSRDELTKVTAQCEQASTKCLMVEQKLKQVSDELSCHRQNAESTRRNMEQKLKDKEKDFQQELSHQQHSLQSLDQQFNQMKNKLNQELQQAKNDYNGLQLESDKVTAHKQKLERELDEIKQQLSRSNQMLKENQTKENDLKKKLESTQEERNCLSNKLSQNSTQIHQLEDELKKTKQDFNRSWNFGEEMKSKNSAQEAEIKSLQHNLDEQSKSMCINMEELKQALDSACKGLKEKEKSMEPLNIKVQKMANEIEELEKNIHLKEKAFQELKEESNSLAQWKMENMHVMNVFQSEKEVMNNKIKELEHKLEMSLKKNQEHEQNLEVHQHKSEKQAEKLRSVEDEKENLQCQTDDLKQILDSKTSELETQRQSFEEFMKEAKQQEQKNGKEIENLNLSISQLTAQIAELEKNLQQETSKVVKLEESQCALIADYENVSNLVKSKECLIELKETEILSLKDNILQTTNNLEGQLAKVEAEKTHVMQEYEKVLLDKLEIENIKSTLEIYQHDISILKEQITSQESLLNLEKQQRSEVENKCEALLKQREELEEKIEEREKKYVDLQTEMEQEVHQLKLQHDEALQATLDEKNKSIENITQELVTSASNLKCMQVANEELEAKLEACLLSEKCIQEKEELISLKEKELIQLSEENEELKNSNNSLMQENIELNKMNSSFADEMKRNETILQELTKKYEGEAVTKENTFKDLKTLYEELSANQRLLQNTVAEKESDTKKLLEKINEKETREAELMQQYVALEAELKHLHEKCSALEENKNFLEMQLHERSQELLMRNTEAEDLQRKHTERSTEYNAKILDYEERIKTMLEEIDGFKLQLEKMEEIDQLKKELVESHARQNKIVEDHNELLQEKEQLMHLITKKTEKETIFTTKLEKLENDLIRVQSENVNHCKLITEKDIISEQLKDTVITKEIELQKVQTRLQLLQMDLEDKEASLESYISQVEQMQSEISSVESKFQNSEGNRILLEKELSSMRTEMENMHLKLNESKNQESALLEQITLQRQTTEELQSEFDKQKMDLDYLHSLQIQLAENQESERQCNLKDEKIKELQKKLCQTEIRISDLMSQNSDIASQQQELKAQMQISLSNMEVALQQSEEQRALLQKDFSKVQSELSAMSSHVIESKRHNEFLMEEITLQKKTNEDLKNELEKSKEQETHLTSMVSELQSLIAALETEKTSLLCKVDLTNNSADLDTQECKDIKEVMIASLECRHKNISEEKEVADIIENHSSDKRKTLLNAIENSPNSIVSDQTTFSVEDDHLKMKPLELEPCSDSSDQCITLLREQLQKQKEAAADQETWELHQTLTATKQELEFLKKNHSSEIEEWQLKLANLTTEMEIKLAAQRQQTEQLTAELEGARVQLQSLDLSSQSLLFASSHSKESTPHKLKHTDSKEHQTEVMIITDQMGSVTRQNVSLDFNVQRAKQPSLQSGKTGESPVFTRDYTIYYNDAKNVSNNIDNELNESNTEQQSIAESTHLGNDKVNVLVEQQSIHETFVGSQLQLDHESGQALQLLPNDENKKITEELLHEIENLHSKLNTNQKELFNKTTVYTELEKKMLMFEEKELQLCNELKSSALENQNLRDKVNILEEELSNITLQLKVDKVKLPGATKMLESPEMNNTDRSEQFLELENELKRAKSDKANLEKHILEMEVDLDKLQIRKQLLEKEHESSQRTISIQAEKLSELETENNEFIQEISTLVETNNELEQTSKRLKEKVQELEAEKIYKFNTIRVLEAEVKKLTSQRQALTEQMEKSSKEKEIIIQEIDCLENNSVLDREGKEKLEQELNQLKKENISILEQTEALQSKLNAVELEKLKLLQSLEFSKSEKSEVAVRLNSTEAEVAEMRHAIEKLKVRIEVDHNKHQHMAEKLKISERKTDSLQDKVEALERELQTSEENMEQMVLEAETAKEQVEILKEEKEMITENTKRLKMDLNAINSEKQALEKQLQESQEKLETECSSLARNSEASENEKVKMTEAYENSVSELQSHISHLKEKMKICQEKLEKLRENERNYLNQNSHLECENIRLTNQLCKADELNVELQSTNTTLSKDLQIIQQRLNMHTEEKEKLQQQIIDLEQLKQKNSMDLSNLHIDMENLKREMNNLQTAAVKSQQEAQDLTSKLTIVQNMKENSEKQLQNELQVAQLQTTTLLDQIHDLTENNRKLQDDLTVVSEKVQKMQQEFDAEKNLISAQLEEFRNQTESIKLQLEICESEKYKLEKDIEYFQNELQITDVLKKELDEHKQRLRCIQGEHQAVLKDLQDQVNGQTENNRKLQDDLTIANEKILKMQQEYDVEKNLISAQLEEFRSQTESLKLQLEISQSEKNKLEKDVGYFQNELQITDVLKKDLDEHKHRLKCIQEEHQAVLKGLQDQVNDQTENNRKLQDDLTIANEKILKMQQEYDVEKNLISAKLEEFRSQTESLKLQLEISQSEKNKLEKDVGYFQNELQITDVLKKDLDEHKHRLKCIQEEHQAVLKGLQDQHDVQMQLDEKRLAGMQKQLTEQEIEMNNLKAAKEEINVTLKDAICKADELQKSMANLKRDKECAQNKLLLWMKSCKQLEHEKESLKKHIQQQEELIAQLQKNPKLESQIDDQTTEVEKLKEALEEKTKEADENMEKYWNLIKSSHKLEEENEMLKSRVVFLSNKFQQSNAQDENGIAEQVAVPRSLVHKCEKKSPGQSKSQPKCLKSPSVCNIAEQTMDAPLELAGNKSHQKRPDTQSNLTAKRVRGAESKEERDRLKSEALQNSAKRTRSDKEHENILKPVAKDKSPSEPEGLPHLVKKGFADIPTVSHSPYILRRTTLLNRASSSVAVQSRISPYRQMQHKGVVQVCNKSETIAESSPVEQQSAEFPALHLDSVPVMAEPPLSSLTNSAKKMGFNTNDGKQSEKRCPMNTKKFMEQKKHSTKQITVSEENENCKVQ
ncbi:centromere protein F [Hemiscyllium ocellatum]|uniref:centromere protein F n=1 Tax=Hemiscyllium ocellatum TaxID=170820 RepID=UPI002965E67E|nr:centromere protein F [Hemiscyllium ocellatum]XP_060687451.1 centromere protein F [Hemiscyllium ocellatum]XP_060687452.1 centromere protein F [Hemiscyllium ocellatum]